MQFLVRLELDVHAVPEQSKADLFEREKAAAAELKEGGSIIDMWRLPGRTATISIWSAPDATALDGLLARLPLLPWMRVAIEPLASHYLTSEALDGK